MTRRVIKDEAEFEVGAPDSDAYLAYGIAPYHSRWACWRARAAGAPQAGAPAIGHRCSEIAPFNRGRARFYRFRRAHASVRASHSEKKGSPKTSSFVPQLFDSTPAWAQFPAPESVGAKGSERLPKMGATRKTIERKIDQL